MRPTLCYDICMKSEHIDGTILIDNGHWTRDGHFAGTTLPDVRDVRVGFDGMIEYAVTGEEGSRVWWFAGAGAFYEDRTARKNAQLVGWL